MYSDLLWQASSGASFGSRVIEHRGLHPRSWFGWPSFRASGLLCPVFGESLEFVVVTYWGPYDRHCIALLTETSDEIIDAAEVFLS